MNIAVTGIHSAVHILFFSISLYYYVCLLVGITTMVVAILTPGLMAHVQYIRALGFIVLQSTER